MKGAGGTGGQHDRDGQQRHTVLILEGAHELDQGHQAEGDRVPQSAVAVVQGGGQRGHPQVEWALRSINPLQDSMCTWCNTSSRAEISNCILRCGLAVLHVQT